MIIIQDQSPYMYIYKSHHSNPIILNFKFIEIQSFNFLNVIKGRIYK